MSYLPELSKSWSIDANTVLPASGDVTTDYATLLYTIKTKLVGVGTVPWTVIGSCDSVTAGLDGVDRWASAANVVWNAGGAQVRSWIVLQQTGLLVGYQVCISCEAASTYGAPYARWIKVYVSTAAGFSGGSTTARPTATDEFALRDGTNGAVTTNSGYWFYNYTTSFQSVLHYMTAAAGDITRIIACASGYVLGYMFFEKLADPVTGLTNDVVAGAQSHTTLRSYAAYQDWNDNALACGRHNTINFTAYLTGEGLASTLVNEKMLGSPNMINSDVALLPIGVASETTNCIGRHGALYDIYWGAYGGACGLTYPATGTRTRRYAQLGDMVFPWNQTIPLVR